MEPTIQNNTFEQSSQKCERERLIEESSKFKLLAENASDMISRMTLEGVFIYVSPSCKTLLGYEPAEMIDKSIYDYAHPQDVNNFQKFHIEAIKNYKDNFIQHRLKNKFNQYVWVESHVKMAADEKTGYLHEVIAISRDITERKRLEALHMQAEQTMEQLINATNDAMCIMDFSGKVLYANNTTLYRLQTDGKNLIGQNIFDFFPKEVRDNRREKFEEVLASSAPVQFEDIRHERNINQTFYPIKDADSQIIKIAYFAYDITEQKQTQETLKQTQETLKQVNKTLKKAVKRKVKEIRQKDSIMIQQSRFAAMGEMLSMIAHQWRQPLNAVSAASINLKMFFDMGVLDEPTINKQCEFIEEQTQRMSKTINDFMEFFRPNKEKQLFFVYDAIMNVEKIIESQLKNRTITLITNIDKSAQINGIKNELEHVILNLLANARDIIEEKNPDKRQISIAVEQNYESIVIRIGDTGGGIPDEIMDRIFDPYFTTKDKTNGTGVGLYMSKIIINRNFGGEIKAYNDSKGAVFVLEIPKNNKNGGGDEL